MRRRGFLCALIALAFFTGTAVVAQADVCEDIPSIGIGPFNTRTPCEAVVHPQKSAEKVAKAVGEAVSHPAKAVEDVVTAPIKAAGDAVMEGVTSWVADGASWLVEQAGKLISETTTPHLESAWFSGEYETMAGIAAIFALPLLLLAVLQGVIRHDGALIIRAAFFYLPLAVLLTLMASTVVQLFLSLTDEMCSQIAASVGSDASSFFAGVAKALKTVAGAGGTASAIPLFAVFLGGLIAAVGAFFVWVELLIRSAGIYVAVFFLPLTFVAMIWPVTAPWCRRLVELLFAIIFAKFVIVAIMALAAAGITHSGSSEAYSGVLAGVALLLLAALSPLALLRMIPMVAGAAHTSWRSGTGSQALGSVAGPAAVMRRVADSNWHGASGSGLGAAPALAGAGAGAAAGGGGGGGGGAVDGPRSHSDGIGGAAGRGNTSGSHAGETHDAAGSGHAGGVSDGGSSTSRSSRGAAQPARQSGSSTGVTESSRPVSDSRPGRPAVDGQPPPQPPPAGDERPAQPSPASVEPPVQPPPAPPRPEHDPPSGGKSDGE